MLLHLWNGKESKLAQCCYLFLVCTCVLCGKERPSIKVHVNPPAARRRCCEGRRQVAVQRGIVETMRAQNPTTSPFGFSMFKALFSESESSEAQIIQPKQEKMFIFRESDSRNFIIISLKVRFIAIYVYSLCVSLSDKNWRKMAKWCSDKIKIADEIKIDTGLLLFMWLYWFQK